MKSDRAKIITLTAVMILSLITIVVFFERLQSAMENQIAEQVVQTEILLAVSGGEQIKDIFHRAQHHLLALGNSFPMEKLFEAIDRKEGKQIEVWKEALTHSFIDTATELRFLFQLRFIDSKGMETIRIERKRGKVYPVKQLQDKSKEEYFSKTMNTEANHFYLSPITPNREFGKTEAPHIMVIRIGTPIIKNGQKRGIIVMNIYMDSIHDVIDTLSQHSWLVNHDEKLLSCSIGLPQSEHEKEIELIVKQPEDSYSLPLDVYHQSEERSIIAFFPIKIVDRKWYVVSEQPFEEISNIMLQSNKIRNVLFVIILAFFTGGLIYFYKLYSDRQKVELKALMAEDLLHLNKQLKRQSIELKSANESLEEIDKRKTDFLNMVAHDLRTPLTSICSYSDLLLRYGNYSGKTRNEFAEIIKKESVRLSRLIDDFLDISKIEAGQMEYKKEEVNIKEVIEHFVALFQGEGKIHKVNIKCEIEKDLLPIVGDRGRLGQVFSNLLSNAIKFTPAAGSIIVKACSITINENDMEEPCNKITITDTGIGIPEDKLEKIFDKFFQLKNRDIKPTRGSGLGLAITKEIVEEHGGKIEVESKEGQGAKFTILLKASVKASGKIAVV